MEPAVGQLGAARAGVRLHRRRRIAARQLGGDLSRADHNFVRLVTASGLSNLADGVFQIALPLVALGVTRDPGAFASVTLVGRLPWLLFSLPAGALADRLDRRRTMTLVNGGRALLIGAL